MKGIRIAFAALALMLLASCSPAVQPPPRAMTVVMNPVPHAVQAQVTGMLPVDVDRLESYPPMPASKFMYVDNVAHRRHYETTGTIAVVGFAGESDTITRTHAATVIMFDDGTGLVLMAGYPAITSGRVDIKYSVPPGNRGEATVVLVHDLRSAR